MDSIWDNIDWKWDGHKLPTKAAVELATSLVKATIVQGIPPEMARSGYLPSVRLLWEGGLIEVEVFSDSFELYYLPKAEDKDSYTISEFDNSSTDSLTMLVDNISDLLAVSTT